MKTYFIAYTVYVGSREYKNNAFVIREENETLTKAIGEWHNSLKKRHRADKIVISFFEVVDE